MLSNVYSILALIVFGGVSSGFTDEPPREADIELICQREQFELHYEPFKSQSADFVRISRGYSHHSDTERRFGTTDRQICRSEFRRQNTARLVLKAAYQRCGGMDTMEVSAGIQHVIMIDYYTSPNHVNRSFTVTCFVPNEGFDVTRYPYHFSLSKGKNKVKNAEEAIFRIGDEFDARIEAKNDGNLPVALHAYPVSCQTVQVTTGTKAEAELIYEGCPSMNDPAGQSMKLTQNISNLGFTQMRFTVNEHYIPWSKPEDKEEIGKFTIECRVLPCTGDRFKGIHSVPQCPRTTLFCYGATTQEKGQLPRALKSYPTVAVSSDFPIRVTEPRKSLDEKAASALCHQKCAMELDERVVERQYTLISLRTTVLLAVLSLLIGISFAAGIWLIHVQTKGKTKRRLRREELSRVPIVTETDGNLA